MKVQDDFDFGRRDVEQDEELTLCAWAENNGWESRKLQYQGRVGAPDRMFYGYGHIVLIEMKRQKYRNRKGGGLSSGQQEEHKRFADRGIKVHVCYTASEGQAVLSAFMGDADLLV